MKKNGVIGIIAGIAVGAAAAVAGGLAAAKVVKEIKGDINDFSFISPEGNNSVTMTYGSSDFAKGLTYAKVSASVESSDDECKLVIFTANDTEVFKGEWSDNDHFKLSVGSGKRRQCCDVDFSGEKINMYYYIEKISDDVIECEVASDEEIEAIENAEGTVPETV